MNARAGIAVVASLAAFAGCAATPAAVPGAAPMQAAPPARSEVRLQAGQSTRVDAASLEIAFTGVTADSRCAKGETCIWEGSATVMLTVSGVDGARELVLHTSARAGPSAAAYGEWAIRLVSLEPFPVAGRAIAPDAYVATLGIERGAVVTESGTQTQ